MTSHSMKNVDVIIISTCVIALSTLGKICAAFGLEWYNSLQLPAFAPANWVFGLVWPILYILTASAAVTLIRAYKHVGYYHTILGFFYLLVILNALWPYLFFIEHSISAALLDVIVLEFTLLTIIFYTAHDARMITLLLVPSACWIAFAIYLNYSLLLLN